MAKINRKKRIPESDLFDIAQYSLSRKPVSRFAQKPVTRQHSHVITKQQEKRKLDKKKALQILNQLIQQDIKKILPHKQPKETKPLHKGIIKHSPSFPPVSAHIIDLRKHYLIEKYNLDRIDRPVTLPDKLLSYIQSLAEKRRFKWHIPKPPRPHREIHKRESPRIVIQQSLLIRPHLSRIVTFAMILIVLIIPIISVPFFGRIINERDIFIVKGAEAISELTDGLTDIYDGDYNAAVDKALYAKIRFQELQNRIETFNDMLLLVAQYIPTIGSEVTLTRAIPRIGSVTADIVRILSDLSTEQSQPSFTDSLKELTNKVQQLNQLLQDTREPIMNIDNNDISPQWQTYVTSLQNHIDDLIINTQRLEKMLTLTQHVLGSDNYVRYLVVLQNNRELRPTGGFMGSFALVDISQGEIINIEFPGGGTYDLNGAFTLDIIPPQPLSIVNNKWYIWDANWWPDFYTSAKKIAWFYEYSQGPTIDGVIAINSDVMVELLKSFGPVELPAYNVVLDEINFYDIVQTEVELNYDRELNQPKKILKDLLPIMFQKLTSRANYSKTIPVILNALTQKDIQIALFDPDRQRIVHDLRWDGSIVPTNRDYLAVISTNIAGGKSDAFIYETIDHRAIIANDGTITDTLTITKNHRAQPNDLFAYVNNVDYVRIYIPHGSTLISASGFNPPPPELFRKPDPDQVVDNDLAQISTQPRRDENSGMEIYDELNHTVFAQWMQVEPGHSTSATVTYKLPFKVSIPQQDYSPWLKNIVGNYKDVDTYSVLFQKQSGKKHSIIQSSVQLPAPYTIAWSDASSGLNGGFTNNVASYGGTLQQDEMYALLLARTN